MVKNESLRRLVHLGRTAQRVMGKDDYSGIMAQTPQVI